MPNEYDHAEAIKQFEESKVGVKGLVDSGVKTIPPLFVHPPETLTDLKPRPGYESQIPTVDLSALQHSRSTVIEQIRKAASTVGFFVIINHGIPEEKLRRTLAALKAFHELPAEERSKEYRRDVGTGGRYVSNLDLYQSKAASWRDSLQVRMGPETTAADPKYIHEVCREDLVEWGKEAARVGEVVLGLLSEGLGLGVGRLKELGLLDGRVMVGHYYPVCPQPDLTVGLNSHADPGSLTLLLQDHVGGLQVKTPDGWVDVKPVPGSLVINIGDLLQIISNEEYRSVDHRVLANSSNEPRLSIPFFFDPSNNPKVFGPLPELTSAEKPALYRDFTFEEYMRRFFKKELDFKTLTGFFKKE